MVFFFPYKQATKLIRLVKAMFYISCFLFLPCLLTVKADRTQNVAVVSTGIDPILDETKVDQQWMNLMITAPTTINILGQIMVVASKTDVSFEKYSPKHVYKYIKYPNSFRATMFQIASGKSYFSIETKLY